MTEIEMQTALVEKLEQDALKSRHYQQIYRNARKELKRLIAIAKAEGKGAR